MKTKDFLIRLLCAGFIAGCVGYQIGHGIGKEAHIDYNIIWKNGYYQGILRTGASYLEFSRCNKCGWKDPRDYYKIDSLDFNKTITE